MLGLPTEPYDAFPLAGNKGITRLMEKEEPGNLTTDVSSMQELDETLVKCKEQVHFSLIMKSCVG